MVEIVGLVPARGGSKGIPRKNLLEIAGRPLLAYTAEAALAARCLHRTLLSTDSVEIANTGRALGLSVPFLRPAALAEDETPMLAVMVHALDWLTSHSIDADVLVLLQPTSPLRPAVQIEECVERLLTAGAETAVSVVRVPHQFNPTSIMTMHDGILRSFLDGPLLLRRQDKPRVYARNGPAVLAVRAATLRAGRLYGDKTVGYEMTIADSLDIDSVDDIWFVEQALRQWRK